MNTQANQFSIKQWLHFGWRSFLASKTISILFSSLFCLIGGILYWLLLNVDAALVIIPFIAGFFLIAPLLIIGFQQAAAVLQQGKKPAFSDLIKIKGENNQGIWFLVFILCLCYFIWITDALVIYGLYFGVEPIPLNESFFTNPELRDSIISYLFHSGLVGIVMAIIGFSLGVFAIPLIIHQQMGFVNAVTFGVKKVFSHKWLMLKWACTLVSIMAFTLIVALPLLVIVLPILGYASYAVYAQIIEKLDIRKTV
ncbi:DUF2189 domain-containing protein [Litorilituus lipolyticus]|uniref:DUF2189 domain-containing protein n=1 Tax=Litorilituus lipolyticus TaxID=2491017 RepID=A0A502L405_9GAMM|nr:DUF2189 domain-containing protein [Litorilituus lipolyticus]TPH18632.1 DUF2189 domain-containing protein [Litorilituus lipolyticus]